MAIVNEREQKLFQSLLGLQKNPNKHSNTATHSPGPPKAFSLGAGSDEHQ